jgi:hypothetical protein
MTHMSTTDAATPRARAPMVADAAAGRARRAGGCSCYALLLLALLALLACWRATMEGQQQAGLTAGGSPL